MMPLADPVLDVALVTRFRAGDAAAATALYRRHATTVYRFSALWTGVQSAAADVTQEVFIYFFQTPEAFDATRGALSSWLLGIARNIARRHVRDAARWEPFDENDEGLHPTLSAEDTPLTIAVRDQDAARLHGLIRALPPVFRDALVLVDLHELSYAEAAAICDCEIGTIRSRLSRARARVASAWSDQHNQQPPHEKTG